MCTARGHVINVYNFTNEVITKHTLRASLEAFLWLQGKVDIAAGHRDEIYISHRRFDGDFIKMLFSRARTG